MMLESGPSTARDLARRYERKWSSVGRQRAGRLFSMFTSQPWMPWKWAMATSRSAACTFKSGREPPVRGWAVSERVGEMANAWCAF